MDWKPQRALVLILSVLVCWCRSDEILDMLSPFINFKELADQVATETAESPVANKDVDRTYPVASVEMDALLKMYRECRTQNSQAMRTWCTGFDEDYYRFESIESSNSCPRGVTTHPCTGQILNTTKSPSKPESKLLWSWKGLRCDVLTEPTTITHIFLSNESLQCEIAKVDLSVMVSLEQLHLSGNRLFGDFPDWLGDMTMLRLLDLGGNNLQGNISSSFAGNDALEQINLSSNNLTASTLTFFDAFHQLQHLDISNNKFKQRLSKSLFASKFLQSINVSYNAFHGDLSILPVFQFLESLDLSHNSLTGNIPPQLSLWGREDPHDPDENSSLSIVDVSHNMLTGDLPQLSNQSNLQRFNIGKNDFTGIAPDFPQSWINQEFARPGDFDGNRFLCPLPSVLLSGNLTCTCGDGYTFKRKDQTLPSPGLNASIALDQQILASEFTEYCELCPKGSYSNSSTRQKCIPCPPGSTVRLSLRERADGCQFCLPGTYASNSASQSCTPCPAGTFSTSDGATVCSSCNPGKFSAQPGTTSCSACGIGTYASTTGAKNCTLCPAGTYVNTKGEAECLLCPANTFQDEAASAGCKTCPTGSVAPYPGHVECRSCSPGSYYNASIKACILCEPGFVTNMSAQMQCNTCANGTVAENFGNDECIPVAAPGLGYDTMTNAIKCEPGMFNDGTWRTCQPCPRGTFAARRGSNICLQCPKGSFASRSGSTQCEMAPHGYCVALKGATRPELCDQNFIAATSGATMCTPCQRPLFSFLPGGTVCSAAKPGEIYDHVEWPRLALELASLELQDLVLESKYHESPIQALLQAWTEILTSYFGSECVLHVLQVVQLENPFQLVRILVAVDMIEIPDTAFTTNTDHVIQKEVIATRKILDELRGKLSGSRPGNGSDNEDVEHLADLIESMSFREALVRRLNRTNQTWALAYEMVNISMVKPLFHSTRALACERGTFFSITESWNGNDRVCVPCPAGSFSNVRGALKCKPSPRGTFVYKQGMATFESCPLGADAKSGATSCVQCSWLTYECNGFWQDLIITACAVAVLLRMFYQKCRALCVGDKAAQQQDESVALMTTVRTHGRSLEGVRYSPMGIISADAMFGSSSETNCQL